MKPYETILVRDMPIRRIRSVKLVGSGQTLDHFSRYYTLFDEMTQTNPNGELIITIPESIIDPLATVIAIELAPPT